MLQILNHDFIMFSVIYSTGNPLTNYLYPDKEVEVLTLKNPFVLDVDY